MRLKIEFLNILKKIFIFEFICLVSVFFCIINYTNGSGLNSGENNMKKKSIFFTLFIFLFGFAGSFLSLLPKDEKVASADTGLSNISVWDGNTPESVSQNDFFQSGLNYYIRSAKGLAYFANQVNTNHNEMDQNSIYLETNINLNSKSWKAIGGEKSGDYTYKFAGTFDGQGHSIYGLTSLSANGNYAGLFGYVSGTIKNLHIKNANFTSNATCIGAIAGSSSGTISGCSVTGTITSTTADYLGGLVGQNSGTVKLCYSKAALTGKNVAGWGYCCTFKRFNFKLFQSGRHQ